MALFCVKFYLIFRFNSIAKNQIFQNLTETSGPEKAIRRALSTLEPTNFEKVGMTHPDRPVNPGDEYTIYILGNGRARYLFCPL